MPLINIGRLYITCNFCNLNLTTCIIKRKYDDDDDDDVEFVVCCLLAK